MARFNEILVGRYNRMVQKLLSMKGPASLVTLSDELTAVIPFFYGVENRYLEGWERFGDLVTITGGVAQQAGGRLRNPSGSNVIGVVEKIGVSASAADQFLVDIGPTTIDLSILDPGTALDTRGRPFSSLVITRSGATPTPLAATILGIQIGGNVPYDFILNENQEIPILPGQALQVRDTTNNLFLRIGMIWRERFLEDSERA